MTKKRNINFDYVHIIIIRVKRFLSFLLSRTNENSKKKTLNDCKLLTAKSTVYDSFYRSILTGEAFGALNCELNLQPITVLKLPLSSGTLISL